MRQENREEYHERKDPEWRVNALSSNSNHASYQYLARNDWTPPIPSFPTCKTFCLLSRLGIKLKTGMCTRKDFGSIHLCTLRKDYYIQTELSWCLWTVVLEKTLDSPLDSKEIQPVNPKGNQSWVFIGRTDAEAETPIFWLPDAKNWLFWKDPDAGKDWRQEETGATEDETVGWHHQFNGHEFE